MPIVSVIIPTYNCEKFLPDALDSVLKQTFQDFEIIVVDDGSTDNTRGLIKSYMDKHPGKINYVYQENMGLACARNTAIRHSKGEYIAILDADDMFMPNRLEEEIAVFEKYPEVGLIHANVKNIDEKGNLLFIPERTREKMTGYIFKQIFLRETNVNIATIMFRRKCLEDAGMFDENLARLGCEDRDFVLRVAMKYKIFYLDRVVAAYRFREGSMSKDLRKMLKARLYVIDKFCPPGKSMILRRRALARIFKDLGDSALDTGSFSEAVKNYGKSLKCWPVSYFVWINLFKTLFHYKTKNLEKSKVDLMQVWNCALPKDCSFGDFAVQIAQKGKAEGLGTHFILPNLDFVETRIKILGFDAQYTVFRNNWKKLGVAFKILREIFKIGPRIADFHFCDSLNFLPVFLFARLAGIEIIYHYHGEIQPLEKLRFINRHFSKLRLLTLFSSRIICVSEANRRYLRALNIQKRMEVIYNGIAIDKFLENSKRSSWNKSDLFPQANIKIVTSIGSLIPRKGMDILLKAFQIVIKEAPEARLVIIGKGDLAPFERLARKLGIVEFIRLTGFLKEYPYGILNSTDLYVSASYAESFGLSIAEAELLGIPVVATRVGGVPEVVVDTKTGFLAPAGDEKALAEKMVLLLKDDNLRKRMGAAGRQNVLDKFSLEERVEELFQNLFPAEIKRSQGCTSSRSEGFNKMLVSSKSEV
ncbi:MAG: glycosyltransferase [Candidatus Omnitrophota bacterium]